jgi:hypothetical protein
VDAFFCPRAGKKKRAFRASYRHMRQPQTVRITALKISSREVEKVK